MWHDTMSERYLPSLVQCFSPLGKLLFKLQSRINRPQTKAFVLPQHRGVAVLPGGAEFDGPWELLTAKG